jgi:hypothetical protein
LPYRIGEVHPVIMHKEQGKHDAVLPWLETCPAIRFSYKFNKLIQFDFGNNRCSTSIHLKSGSHDSLIANPWEKASCPWFSVVLVKLLGGCDKLILGR